MTNYLFSPTWHSVLNKLPLYWLSGHDVNLSWFESFIICHFLDVLVAIAEEDATEEDATEEDATEEDATEESCSDLLGGFTLYPG